MKDRLIEALSNLKETKLDMTLSGVSYFQKGERMIYYREILPNPTLKSLHQAVLKVIEPLNIGIHGSFSPHITLLRQAKPYPVEVLKLPLKTFMIPIQQVTLFLSHSTDDELTYTPLYRVSLI